MKTRISRYSILFFTAFPVKAAVTKFNVPQGFSVGVNAESFISKSFQTQRFYEIGFKRNSSDAESLFSVSADAVATLGMGCNSCSFFEIKELIVRGPVVEESLYSAELSAGRKPLNWSEVDRFWSLGILDPRFRNDELGPLQSGLTGFFLEQKYQSFEFGIFASPLYIPERGTSIRDDGGRLTSDSAWFVSPPKEVLFLDYATPIRYQVNVPATSAIVNQFSIGARLATSLWSGAKLSLFAMQKPSNQLPLSYDAVLDLSSLNAHVDLFPRVIKQSLVGMDISQEISNTRVHAGVFKERFSEISSKDLEQGATAQKFAPAEVYALDISRAFDVANRVGLFVSAAGIKVAKNNDSDEGPAAQPSGMSIFSDRYLFREAVRLTAGSSFSLFKKYRDSQASFSYTRDTKFDSEILTASILWNATSKLTLALRADFLSAKEEKDGFVGQFRSNDRLVGGVHYVF